MKNIPRYSIPNSLSIRLDIGTEIDLLSNKVSAVAIFYKGPPNYNECVLAHNNKDKFLEEVFFYDPHKEDSNGNIIITNNAVECNVNITEPGDYTFWVEVFYNEHKFIGNSCDAYFE